MKAFIQSTPNGMPTNECHYMAKQGFEAMGIETVPFWAAKPLAGNRREDVVVGGVGTVNAALIAMEINVPEMNYPKELKNFYGRALWKTSIDKVLSDRELRPVFVKPERLKRFTGTILRTENDVPRLVHCADNEPVWCSEVIDIFAEWRAFIRYGKVLDVRPYRGDWRQHFDATFVEKAVAAWKTAPAGCALDFGVTHGGKTLVIEANDGFSLGNYGLASVDYAKLLSARWAELTGTPDECDILHERESWIKRKKPK